MKPEELTNEAIVINKKYGSREIVLDTNALMKDSQKGWIPAVVYYGPDRFNPDFNKTFCKNLEDFLEEFELEE